MAYISPGRLFVKRFGTVTEHKDLIKYAEFLRTEAGITTSPPVDLNQIYARFEIPTPERVPLSITQGLVVDHEIGIILINQDDPAKRQRFTEAHELMELLFAELPENPGDHRGRGNFGYEAKERLCNAGAAELLMPRESFSPYVEAGGCSFKNARKLGEIFDVSVTAALVQSARLMKGACAVVLFRPKNKPTEIQSAVSQHQPALIPDIDRSLPTKKLRVEWSLAGPFIPKDKSVSEDSIIYAAWQTGEFTSGIGYFDLGPSVRGRFSCESWPFEAEGEIRVLTLLSRTR